MRRRQFIALLGGAAVSWPHAARAQQPAMPVVGLLATTSPRLFSDNLLAFRRGLGETGFVEGRNVSIEYHWAENHNERLPDLAADLVRQQVAAVVTLASAPAALAAKAATTTIPIVFETAADPVAVGLVDSLSRPGGNVTGITSMNVEIGPKRLELLHELVPTAASIAFLVNPSSPVVAQTLTRDVQIAARTLGLPVHVLHASTDNDLDAAFAVLVERKVGALVIRADPFFKVRIERLAALALQHRVPAISQLRDFATVGGLVSYGGSPTDAFRLAGVYAGRILNGAKPADLPVVQSSKFELVINVETTRMLGLEIPSKLLAAADEVIE